MRGEKASAAEGCRTKVWWKICFVLLVCFSAAATPMRKTAHTTELGGLGATDLLLDERKRGQAIAMREVSWQDLSCLHSSWAAVGGLVV